MVNKKENGGLAHLGPRGLHCVVCSKCSVSQKAVSTVSAGANRGRSRLLAQCWHSAFPDSETDEMDTTAVVLVLVRTRNHK